ncbi:MAG: RluA family pseudouridine synthase [Clostridia bacterium]|nr:RluA family pseudouridine synthase [Clostridia bacterium]
MRILYSDEDLVVVNKEKGQLSQKDEKRRDTLPDLLERETGGEIFPVHRLDRETSGVMVYARNSRSAAHLSREIAEGFFEKEYFAVLHRAPEESEGALRDYLYYDRSKNKVFPVKRLRKGVKEARLRYRILKESDGLFLAEVFPETGRTHQIRVQFASRGCPLWGDKKYGGEGEGLALHCRCLRFCHPKTKEMLSFVCEPDGSSPWDRFPPQIIRPF